MDAHSGGIVQRRRRSPEVEHPGGSDRDVRHLVVGAAALMTAATTAFNAWALYNGWFYADDYALLVRAQQEGLDLDYLLRPHDARLLPGTRLIAEAVQAAGMSWTLAATITLTLKLVAAVAAGWMLVTLFGARWGVLAPLALYLTTAMTVPAMMWWTASLNQTPVQIAFFVSVGAWVRYLRERRLRWLSLTTAALAFGLLFFVKTLLVVGVLGYLALAYFATGSLWVRFRTVAVTYWPAVAAGLLLGGAYFGVASSVETAEPFRRFTAQAAGGVAETMLGTAFPTGALGGPWTWERLSPPGSVADPPGWAATLSWVLLVAVVLYTFLRRDRTMRAWALLACYLAALLSLIVMSRARQFGGVIGLEYRFFTDAACAVALCVALAFLPLRGAAEPSRPRERPYLALAVSARTWTALVCVVAVSGVLSSASYVRNWHNGNLSEFWVKSLRGELRREGSVDLLDRAVPRGVLPAFFAPDTRLSRFVQLLSDDVRFPESSPRLLTVADDGSLRPVLIDRSSSRERRVRPCGWKVESAGRTIRMPERLYPWLWWIRIDYLSSAPSPVTVSSRGQEVQTSVEAGLNNLYVRMRGPVGDVRLDGLDAGVTVCVESVEIGEPEPGGPR